MRIAIGPKDLENRTFEIARRDTLTKEVVQTVMETKQVLLLHIGTELLKRKKK